MMAISSAPIFSIPTPTRHQTDELRRACTRKLRFQGQRTMREGWLSQYLSPRESRRRLAAD